ncbi:MAG: hypothetical protein AB8G99_03390 [Planctomycetaceae bacterium]
MIVLGLPTFLPGQESNPQSQPAEKLPAGYYHRLPDGKLINLAGMGVSDDEIEKLLRDGKIERPPQYVVSSVDLAGKVEGKLAYLDAVVSIRLNVEENRWVSVPIAMDEGKIAGRWEYDGKGEAVFDRKTTASSGTRHWFFRGPGRHKLTLPLVVQIREPQHLRYSLRLRLPDAAASSLALEVPANNITVEPPRNAGQRVTRTDAGTRVEMWGLGTQFATQWEVRPDVTNSKPILRSVTNLSVNLTQDPYAITARQRLILQQGSVDSIKLRLPAGLVSRSNDPQQIDPTGQVSQIDADDETGQVTVRFNTPLTGQLDLNWPLVASNQELVRRWTFKGIQVAGAQEQSTELELTPPEGVAIQPIKLVGVQRQNTRSSRADQRITRCRLLNAESEFTVELRDVEPFYTVTPRTVLWFQEGQLRLESRFRIRVLRGSLQELKLSWPGIATEDWKLLPLPIGDKLTDWTTDDAPIDDALSLKLVTRSAGTFEIGISAVRTLTTMEKFPVSLPSIVSETRQPTTVVLATTANLDVDFEENQPGSAPIPVDGRMTNGIDLPDQVTETRALLVRSDEKSFTAQLQTRERQLSTESDFVLDVKSDGINVEETITYQLDFDHIAALGFVTATGIEPTVSLDDGTILKRETGTAGTIRYLLPEPMIGRFSVQVRYRVPYDAADSDVTIPMLVSSDSPSESVRVGIKPGAIRRATPVGSWAPIFSRRLEAEWVSDQAVSELQLKLTSPTETTARNYSVGKAVVQSKVSGDTIEGRVNFVVTGQFPQLVLNVPDGTRIGRVGWNNQTLPGSQWEEDFTSGAGILTVQQQQRSGTGLLTIDYRSSAPSLSWLRRFEPKCPTMPEDTEISEIVWQIIMPVGEHLAGYQSGLIPCFEWSLSGFGWSRQSTDDFRDLGAWLTTAENAVVRTAAGNAYSFQLPRLRSSIRVSTVDQSFLLLFGSGAAFLAAFMMIRYSPRRFAIALPAIGLLLSILSLWYTPAMQLLLQPAILGVALATVAFFIDRSRYRRGYGAYSIDQDTRPSIPMQQPGTASTMPHAPVAASGSSQ